MNPQFQNFNGQVKALPDKSDNRLWGGRIEPRDCAWLADQHELLNRTPILNGKKTLEYVAFKLRDRIVESKGKLYGCPFIREEEIKSGPRDPLKNSPIHG